jgi:plastocyanin
MGSVLVRRNVYDLTADEIASLRRGVAVMKGRPETDPTSWIFQANLHAVPALPEQNFWCQHSSWYFFPWHRMYLYWFERILRAASGDSSLTLPYWNYSDNLAHRLLPDTFRTETDETGALNPLFEPRRAPDINTGSVGLSDGAVDYSGAFQRTNFFVDGSGTSFGGQKETTAIHNGAGAGDLEITPHGDVHVEIGNFDPTGSPGFGLRFTDAGTYAYQCSLHPATMQGTITVTSGAPLPNQFVDIIDFAFVPQDLTIPAGTVVVWINYGATPHTVTSTNPAVSFDSGELIAPGLMAMPKLAARDPIFWLHHANIDRLWNRWLEPLVGGSNPPAGETDWYDQTFPFFDETGAPVELTARQVVDSASCLGYRYDDDPVPALGTPTAFIGIESALVSEPRKTTTLGETDSDQPILLGAEQVEVAITLGTSTDPVIDRITKPAATPTAGGVIPQMVLSLENMAYEGGPLLNYAVYVNLPPEETADFRSEFFVGNIYLFGLLMPAGHQMPGQLARQNFDVTRAVQTSQERGEWKREVAVSFLPQSEGATDGALATPAAATVAPTIPAGPSISIERMTVVAIE